MSDLIHDGSYAIFFCTTITAPATPLNTEISAGTRLDGRMTPTGWDWGAGNDTVDVSKLNSLFTTMQVGRRTFAPVVTIIREATDTGGVEAALAFKAVGFLAIRTNLASTVAVAASQKWSILPIQTGAANPGSPAPNQVQTIGYPFTMTADGFLNGTST